MMVFCDELLCFFCRYTYGKPVDGTVLAKFSMVGGRFKDVSVRKSSEQVIF